MLIVKLAMLYEGVFALKKMGASTALADRSGGQFAPECLVSLPRNGVVNLTRNQWSLSRPDFTCRF
jgi:hypothetical protein